MSATPTVLVTGAGRGIGRSVVELFSDSAWRVVAGVRDVAAAQEAYAGRENVHVVHLDVRDAASVRAGVAAAEELAGGALTCLVSNAGYAVLGAVEDADLEVVREMFDTNFFGAAAVVQAALPAMREAGRGSVVFVSSIGARLSNPLLGMYHASKYALSAMAEALAIECRAFGIRVVAIEPGMVDTDFPKATRPTGALSRGEGPYLPLLAELRQGFGAWRERNPTSPDVVAMPVLGAAESPEGPFRIPVGDDAMLLARARETITDDSAWQDELLGFLQIDWPRRTAAPPP